MEFEKELINILNTYTDGEWTVEPLDGDEVDKLVETLRNKLNLLNGNITKDEYDNKMEGDDIMNIEDLDRDDLLFLIGCYSNYVVEFYDGHEQDAQPVSVYEFLENEFQDILNDME